MPQRKIISFSSVQTESIDVDILPVLPLSDITGRKEAENKSEGNAGQMQSQELKCNISSNPARTNIDQDPSVVKKICHTENELPSKEQQLRQPHSGSVKSTNSINSSISGGSKKTSEQHNNAANVTRNPSDNLLKGSKLLSTY